MPLKKKNPIIDPFPGHILSLFCLALYNIVNKNDNCYLDPNHKTIMAILIINKLTTFTVYAEGVKIIKEMFSFQNLCEAQLS